MQVALLSVHADKEHVTWKNVCLFNNTEQTLQQCLYQNVPNVSS